MTDTTVIAMTNEHLVASIVVARSRTMAHDAGAKARRDLVLEIIEREGEVEWREQPWDARARAGGAASTRAKRLKGEAARECATEDDSERDDFGSEMKGEGRQGKMGRGRGGEASTSRASAPRAAGDGEGVRDAALAEQTAHAMSVTERAQAINELLSARKIEIFKRGEELVYARSREEQAAKFKGLSTEDMLVYQIIQHAGNAGMWTKELKARSNLPAPQITKIFKTLEARKLIKAVKHVAQQNRKVYMLFELEPSREITGGAWYTEHEYDAEFINVLREQCVKFIYSRDRVTLEEVSDFVRQSKLSHVELGADEVLQIVNTLVYDGKVDADEDESADDGMADAPDEAFVPTTYYRKATLPIPESNAYTDIPCGVCPVINECRPDGLINPISCEYMTAWLDY